ncbi:hypothetical protein [Nocardiopsis sp. NRRL B-16309]|uniref:hypothetical protein n=1 Tax=Nocardiopsis sp. NRRL B-16309 TaxID=1519494 RepID=UPI0006AF418D|nr:hypothetical protein [Nocardiopsis sp. NRRL B-16309]KOX10226.1 hypothetical protein ADL05_26560 [Nocardiopsis sp. NRRL B-16309]
MATTSAHVRGLTPDDISVLRDYPDDTAPFLLNVADVLIDVRPGSFNPDTAVLIAALERLAELALEVASEIRTGQPTTDTRTNNS